MYSSHMTDIKGYREAFPIGIGDIAHMLGVTRGTVDAWHGRRRRQTGFPPPDMTISGRPAWWAETIIDWALWTGRIEVKIGRRLPVAEMQPDGKVTIVWPEKGES